MEQKMSSSLLLSRRRCDGADRGILVRGSVSSHCLGLGAGKSPSFGFLSSELGDTLSSLESQ